MALLGCRSSGDPTASEPTAWWPTMSSVDGPVLRYPAHGGRETSMLDAPIWGRLVLEGDCLYVARADVGVRYLIVWPYGTSWDAAAGAVLLPTGERLPMGTDVEGGGGFFEIDDVDRIVDAAAEARALECVGDATGTTAAADTNAGADTGGGGDIGTGRTDDTGEPGTYAAFVNNVDDGIARATAGG